MAGFGALESVLSMGRELFGLQIRANDRIADIAKRSGVTMDTLRDTPPETLSDILNRAARSGAIDPRHANSINIHIAQDAQAAMPALSPQIDPTQTGFIFKDVKPIGPLLNKFENKRLSSGMAQPEVTTLPIRSMYASQPNVNPDFSTTESSSGSLPLVIKKNGELFVSDGHHRLTKLASEGEQNARVRLIDFDEPTDTPLLNYNPNQSAEDDALLEQLFGGLPKDTE
ncbi:hypothetical protein OAU55_00280 [Candidatus Pelagibacter sp.]|nr:hypothetical protein [Candidatus Pelagibacter sp.]